MTFQFRSVALAAALPLVRHKALAAPSLPGAAMTWPWTLPFLGILLSTATGPLLFPRTWHLHYEKVAFAWAALTLLPLAGLYGAAIAVATFGHAAGAEYLSFIVLLCALYVVAGGILVTGDLGGTPWTNAGILAFGTVIASLVGTTAPLRGVEFSWLVRHLWWQTAIVALSVLAIFVALDVWMTRGDKLPKPKKRPTPIKVRGLINVGLIAVVIFAILVSATWKPGIAFDIYGTHVELQSAFRDAVLTLVALSSLHLTAKTHRKANGFTFEPIREVAILFAGIFVAIIPMMAMLHAGREAH